LLPTGFVPAADRNQTQVTIELPPGSTLAETARATEAARRLIMEVPHTVAVFASVGGGSSGDAFAPGAAAEARRAVLTITTVPRQQRPEKMTDIDIALRARFFEAALRREHPCFGDDALGQQAAFALERARRQTLLRVRLQDAALQFGHGRAEDLREDLSPAHRVSHRDRDLGDQAGHRSADGAQGGVGDHDLSRKSLDARGPGRLKRAPGDTECLGTVMRQSAGIRSVRQATEAEPGRLEQCDQNQDAHRNKPGECHWFHVCSGRTHLGGSTPLRELPASRAGACDRW
jgi:hypothetical protein